MKHYTENIPQELAEKLKGVGMPIDRHQIEDKSPEDGSCSWKYEVTYAEVIDWLMEKDKKFVILESLSGCGKSAWVFELWGRNVPYIKEVEYGTWHEAANKAIEFAVNKMKKQ